MFDKIQIHFGMICFSFFFCNWNTREIPRVGRRLRPVRGTAGPRSRSALKRPTADRDGRRLDLFVFVRPGPDAVASNSVSSFLVLFAPPILTISPSFAFNRRGTLLSLFRLSFHLFNKHQTTNVSPSVKRPLTLSTDGQNRKNKLSPKPKPSGRAWKPQTNNNRIK